MAYTPRSRTLHRGIAQLPLRHCFHQCQTYFLQASPFGLSWPHATLNDPPPLHWSNLTSDKHYSDKDTFDILANVSKVLKLPIPKVLHFVGDYQLDSLLDKGFGPLVRTLGASFYEMLTNLE